MKDVNLIALTRRLYFEAGEEYSPEECVKWLKHVNGRYEKAKKYLLERGVSIKQKETPSENATITLKEDFKNLALGKVFNGLGLGDEALGILKDFAAELFATEQLKNRNIVVYAPWDISNNKTDFGLIPMISLLKTVGDAVAEKNPGYSIYKYSEPTPTNTLTSFAPNMVYIVPNFDWHNTSSSFEEIMRVCDAFSPVFGGVKTNVYVIDTWRLANNNAMTAIKVETMKELFGAMGLDNGKIF